MAEPVLELCRASFAYPRSGRVLDGVDLALRPGERIALLGANGSGKSTLLRLLVALDRPGSGDLVLDGRVVGRSRAERTRLRSAVQLVLQEPDDQIVGASVRADISFGPVNQGRGPEEVRARVEQSMAMTGVADLADEAPHLLSFGQRKRVTIAGALAMQPRILLLDEATAGLDPRATVDLLDTLAALADAGTAVVLATHDVDAAWAWAGDAVVLTGGRVRRGAVHEVLADRDLLAGARLTLPWGAAVSEALGRTVRVPGDV